MKRLLLPALFFSTFLLNAQNAVWTYTGEINFPPQDSAIVQPYLCTVDDNGRLYVVSSKTTSAEAHNSIYFADSSSDNFTKMIDFTAEGDTSVVGAIRGIGSLGNNIWINMSQNFSAVGATVAAIYYYPNGEVNNVQKYGFNIQGSGYGTYIHGLGVTEDTVIYTGISFNTSIRFYNFNDSITTPAKGSWVSMSNYPLEPGGPHSGGFDVIRDVALIPGGDYNNPETPWYTSRNSLSSSQITGGIAIWSGGTQLDPGNYSASRVSDAVGDLNFDKAIPYGIDVDKNKVLWVAGTDSTRRWVKGYEVLINFAQELFELPGQNSMSNPDPSGSPMTNPSDVALSADARTAYVIDAGTQKAYRYKLVSTVSADAVNSPLNFVLSQNYPNPFNPSTVISYSVPMESSVKIIVSNALGEEIATLVNEVKSAGKYKVNFDAKGLSSGIYYYTLTTSSGRISKKMTLIK